MFTPKNEKARASALEGGKTTPIVTDKTSPPRTRILEKFEYFARLLKKRSRSGF